VNDLFPDIGEGLTEEWIVTAAGGEQMLLQLAYFDRGRGVLLYAKSDLSTSVPGAVISCRCPERTGVRGATATRAATGRGGAACPGRGAYPTGVLRRRL
jgi:hypothetical protein